MYAPLRAYLAVTSDRHAAALASRAPTPEQETLLASLSRRPQVPYLNIPAMPGLAPRIQRLTISLSDTCNLRCVYCHAYRPLHRAHTLPVAILEPLIAAFVTSAIAPMLYFEFLGDGEPTLVLPHLKRCIELIHQHRTQRPFASRILLTTNGYFGPVVRRYLLDHIDEFTVSLDGFKAVHDRHRPRLDGGSSYRRVYETVRVLHQANARVTLRITVTPLSIDHLDSVLAFLANSFPGIAVRIEPVRSAGRALECFQDLTRFAEQVTAAIASSPVLRGGGLKLAKPYNGEGTMYDNIRTIGCPMLEYANWQVAADGSISCCGTLVRPNPLLVGTCDFQTNSVPSLAEPMQELQDAYHVKNLPGCSDCFCKFHCAGGCPVYPPADLLRYCHNVRAAGTDWLHARSRSATTPRTPASTVARSS